MNQNYWSLFAMAALLAATGCTGSTTLDTEQTAERGVSAVVLKVHGFKKSASGAT